MLCGRDHLTSSIHGLGYQVASSSKVHPSNENPSLKQVP